MKLRVARLRWVALGLLLLQLGWILALPPFGGIDEFDHVYRASAVAHGEWVSEPEEATRGTGATVSVSRAIVEAARPECQHLAYTGPEDCVGSPSGDRVEIASGAGRYHPLYYAAVGYPAALFDGVRALYVMRLVSALLCLALTVTALAMLRKWAGPRAVLAACVGVTPMVVYSTSVVAPNGLEMVSGFAFWIALAGLGHDSKREREVWHLVLALVAGGLLVSMRSFGPLWAVLVLGTALIAWGGLRRRLRELLGRPLGWLALAIAVITSGASLAWILLQRSLVIGVVETEKSLSLGYRLKTAAEELPLWFLQTIAAFPLRNQPAPTVVYACYAILLGFVVLGGLRWARGGPRAAIALGILLSFAIPFVITVVTLTTFGTAWQGRYALPYLLGTALVSGLAWAKLKGNYRWQLLLPGLLLFAIAQVASPVAVLAWELRHSPLAGSDTWYLAPAPWAMAVLTTVGAVFFALPLIRGVQKDGSR